jgi:hypothetical protein
VTPFSRGLALAVVLLPPTSARAGDKELRAVLDFTARPSLLDTHLARFGPTAAKAITKEPGGVRVMLPGAKNPGQTGVYSYFALAGDLEVTAGYEFVTIPAPQGGYGVGVSVILDTSGSEGAVSITRGHHPKRGVAYWVTRATPGDDGPRYDTQFFPASGKRGTMVVRREKGVVVFGASQGENPVQELASVPFTAGTVRQLRIAVDTGGSSTPVDVRVTGLIVRAEEATGGIPEAERRGARWVAWVSAGVAVGALGGIGRWAWRRARNTSGSNGPRQPE